MCAQPACSNTTVTDIVGNITSGCATDLNTIGVPGFTPQSLLEVFETSYPALREVACLTECVYGSFRTSALLLMI